MDKFNFEQVKKNLDRSRRELLVLLSYQAQDYFLKSFKEQGFDEEPWKEVQRRIPGTKAYKYPKKKGLQRRTSPILVGAGYRIRGGTLSRAVSTMARGKSIQMRDNGFRMIVDVPYAGYLNEGTDKMVKRQFVGQTQELTNMQKQEIDKIISRIWKS